MKNFLLLTLSGPDRTGIVAALTRSLFEAGCHIEDSTMTRLRGELVIMMLLRQPTSLPTEAMSLLLNTMAGNMGLSWSMREVVPQPPATTAAVPADVQTCLIHVQGANQPGIVYRVTAILARLGGNVTNLRTQINESTRESIYTMTIEADIALMRYRDLQRELDDVAHELRIAIKVQEAVPYAYPLAGAGIQSPSQAACAA